MKQRTSEPYPAWADAQLALKYMKKGKARGSKFGLWVRGESQKRLGHVGKWAGRRGGLVIFVGIVSLALLCVGIQNIRLDTTLASLWTPDSGELLTELNYVSKLSGSTADTNEMLIQTPKAESHHSMLNSKALLEHLEVLQKALSVTVDLYDVTWSMKDLCYSANIPTFDVQFIDQIFEKVFPCVIVTPLDCFWEGAKLLGPDFPIQIPGFGGNIKWTNLNPQELLMKARLLGGRGGGGEAHMGFFEILEGFMRRAGIGTGYQEKPCLNPKDPECPITSPNKGSVAPPDVASIMAQGCYGFAPRFMHWAPDLIIGGPTYNKSGHIIKAGGLMSTVQLMSSSELYDFFRETWRLNHVEWSEPKAQAVLTAWQTRFAEEVSHLTLDDDRSHKFNFYSFTPSGLDSVVESASQFSWKWGGIRVGGVLLSAVVVGLLFDGGQEQVSRKIRAGLIVGGIAIALLGTVAGCGVAALLKIPFNVASVQVLPYLAMALVSQVLYILLYSQLNTGADAKTTLKKYGFSLLLGILVASTFIATGAVFPIPAVRSLALQGAIFFAVGSVALLVVYPAFCQLILKKKKSGSSSSQNSGVNVVNSGNKPASGSLRPNVLNSFKNNNITLNNEKNGQDKQYCNLLNNEKSSNGNRPDDIEIDMANDDDETTDKCSGKTWTSVYLRILTWKWFSRIIVTLYLGWIGVSVFGCTKLRLGLPITDVVPSHSAEWEFLTAQSKLFPVYNIRAVTKSNFDYPNNQKLLQKFHDTMSSLPWVIRDDNGGVPQMWLSVFRSWLLRLQGVFDKEWKLGYLHKEGWTDLASADGILAWKLAVQTGHVEHPVDITQLPSNRLVDSEGVINTRAFYVYLTAWAWNDPLAYGSTASNLKPEPRNWVHSPEDKDLKIPRSAPIKYAEISYLVRTSKDDGSQEDDQESQILAFVKNIREICKKYEERGLPVFPWGIPFRFYDQYLKLPDYLMFVAAAVASAFLILVCSLGGSIRASGVVFVVACITGTQIIGAIGWLRVGLNALPVDIALLGVSLVVFPTVQIVVAFCCIPGTVSDRRSVSFTLVGPPCVQSLILITLTALILYSPDFTFIFTYFTLLVCLSSIFSLLNILLLVPVLLALLKPPSWLVGLSQEDPSYLQPLTPSPIPKRGSNSRSSGRNGGSSRTGGKNSSRGNYPPAPYSFRGSNSRNNYYHGSNRGGHNRAPSEHSLSTITEEPTSCATRRSAEFVVEPRVVVETFDREPNGSSTTTKVSAKFKVEVHSSMHSSNSNSNPQSSVHTSSENSGTSTSTSSSGSFTSSSASSTSSYNERMSMDE